MSELVNHERAWLQLKAYIAEKRSHGSRELAEVMARLEVDSMYRDEEVEAPSISRAPDARPLTEDAQEPSAAMPQSKDPLNAQGGDSWTPTPAPPMSSSTPPGQITATGRRPQPTPSR